MHIYFGNLFVPNALSLALLAVRILSIVSLCTHNALSICSHPVNTHCHLIIHVSNCIPSSNDWCSMLLDGGWRKSLSICDNFRLHFTFPHILSPSVCFVYSHYPHQQCIVYATIFSVISLCFRSFCWYLQYYRNMIQINWLRYKPIWLKCRRKHILWESLIYRPPSPQNIRPEFPIFMQ